MNKIFNLIQRVLIQRSTHRRKWKSLKNQTRIPRKFPYQSNFHNLKEKSCIFCKHLLIDQIHLTLLLINNSICIPHSLHCCIFSNQCCKNWSWWLAKKANCLQNKSHFGKNLHCKYHTRDTCHSLDQKNLIEQDQIRLHYLNMICNL